MSHLHDLLREASTINIRMTGVDYNDDYEHKDDDAIPSILVYDPQEFARPPLNVISIFGDDDKVKSGCGRDVEIPATGRQSVRTIVAEVQAPSASYHNFNTEQLIPPVTHCMKITSYTGDYLYRGVE